MTMHLTPEEARRLGMAPRANKWHTAAKEDCTYNGVVYHSSNEARVAFELDMRLRAHEIAGWLRQVPYKLVVNGHPIATYHADFLVTHRDGTLEAIEVKGAHVEAQWLKWCLFRALYEAEWQAKGWKVTLRQV